MTLVATDEPGVYLARSASRPGTFHTVRGVGTPFLVCDCPGAQVHGACRHTLEALAKTEEILMSTQPDTKAALTIAENSPVVVRAAEMQLRVASHLAAWNTFRELGAGMVASGLMPPAIKSAEQAALILMKAYSLGIEPAEAFDVIDVIEGRPFVRAQAVRALVARSGLGRIEVVEATPMRAVAVGTRPGWRAIQVVYTIEDAKRAGLTSRANWDKHPADMLVARASVRVARRMFADVLSGMVADEDGGTFEPTEDIGGQASYVDGEAREVETAPVPRAEYPWEATLREELEIASIGVEILASVVGKPVTYGRIDEWLTAHPDATPHDLVRMAADARAARK